ncbi:hypothetical protein AS005_05430 [Thermotoga sp. KOL6]|nr:hypothetical protein AS005_05430 [Thermotoga sp. KOL6]
MNIVGRNVRFKKSKTYPNLILSKRFPKAPPRMNPMAIFSNLVNFKTYGKRERPTTTNNTAHSICSERFSKSPKAIPLLVALMNFKNPGIR